jgi:glycerol-3-phosphate cytidylyltransferase
LVRKEKNKTPVINQDERIEIVESIRYVDKVVPQFDKNKMAAFEVFKFDKMFVGSDWRGTDVWNKFELDFSKIGVEIIYLDYTEGISSTVLTNFVKNNIKD